MEEEEIVQQEPPRLSPSDFAKNLKAKYPQYESIEDDILVEKMLVKYPVYKDKIDFSQKKNPDLTSNSITPLQSLDSPVPTESTSSDISEPQPQKSKIEEGIDFAKTLTRLRFEQGMDVLKHLASGTSETLAGLSGIPNFINKIKFNATVGAAKLLGVDGVENFEETVNNLPQDKREKLINSLDTMNNPISGALSQVSAAEQDVLTNLSDTIKAKTKQYEGNIVDDITSGNIEQAALRAVNGMAESAPSLVLAAAPGGLLAIGAGTASQKQERLEREGEDLDTNSILNSIVNGTAEGVFEKATAGLLKPLKGVLKGNKELAQQFSESFVTNLFKSVGIEASSEAATAIIQQLSDAYFMRKEDEEFKLPENFWKNVADAGLIGGLMGGAISTTTIAAKRIMEPEKSKAIDAAKQRVNEIDSELQTDIPDNLKEELRAVKSDLEGKIDSETQSAFEKFKSLPKEERIKLGDLENQLDQIKNEHDAIKENPNISEESKKVLLENKVNQAKELLASKQSIINAETEATTDQATEQEVEGATPKNKKQKVYHGTGVDFRELDFSGETGKTDYFGAGVYVTTERDLADFYSKNGNDSKILEFELDIKNPLDSKSKEFKDLENTILDKKELSKEIQKRGYDAVEMNLGEFKNYVVFNKESLKESTKSNEATPTENPTPDGNVQPTTDPTSSQGETRTVTSKGFGDTKVDYNVEFDGNGNVSKITSPKDGREIPRFIERKVKPTKANPTGRKLSKNGNFTKIESDALGIKTDNSIRAEEKAKVDQVVSNFEPSNEYEAVLNYLATGGRVKLGDAISLGQDIKGGKWAAGFNNEADLPSIERASEIISEGTNLDVQVVRDNLESTIMENGSVDDIRNRIVKIAGDKSNEIKEQELYYFKNSLSQEELSIFESSVAEDEYLSELTYDEKVQYYREQFQSPSPEVIGERNGGTTSVQGNEGVEAAKKPEIEQIEKQIADATDAVKTPKETSFHEKGPEETQAQGITGNDSNNRDSALSDGGAVKELNPFQKQFKRFWNNTFKTNQGAPKEVAKEIRSLGHELSAITDAIEYEASKIKDISKSIKKSTPKQFNERLKLVNEYLTGNQDADVSFLNVEQLADLDILRARVDELSARLQTKLDEALQPLIDKLDQYEEGSLAYTSISESIQRTKDLIQTIEDNKGSYLSRSYDAFRNPKYLDNLTSKNPNAEGRKRIQKVVDYIQGNAQDLFGSSITEKDARQQIFTYLDGLKNNDDFIGAAATGKANAPFLKKRKEIPVEIRELLGESKDPILNYVNTVFQVSKYIANLEYQNRMASTLEATGLVKYEADAGYTRLAPETEGWNAFGGIYVPTELATAIQDLMPLKTVDSGFYKGWIKFAAFTKIGKTVFSPTTTARNFISGVFLGFNAGFNFAGNPKVMRDAFFQAYGTEKSKSQQKAEREKLFKLGVLGDGAISQEVMETMNDFSKEIDRMISKNALQHSLNFTKKVYALGDSFYKVIGYYQYKSRYMKSGLNESSAEIKAAERINDTFPTYSMIPKNIQELRRIPLVGTFVSFPYEVFRTTNNTFKYLAEDISQGRTSMAMKQIGGMLVANATLIGLSALTRSMIGFDDEDDNKFRDMLPEWQINSSLIYTGKEDGQPRFIDGTALFPSETIIKPIRTLLETRNSRSWGEKLSESFSELYTPYLGLDISFKTMKELMDNQDSFGREIYKGGSNESGPVNLISGIFSDPDAVAQYYLKQAGPGVYNNITEFLRANDISPETFGDKYTSYGREYTNRDALMGLVGFRFSTLNYASGMTSLGYDAKDKYGKTRNEVVKKMKTTRLLGHDEIQDLVSQYRVANEEVGNSIMTSIKSARKLGLNEADIEGALRLSGFSKQDSQDLINGFVPLLKPISKVSIKDQEAKIKINLTDEKRENELINNLNDNISIFNELIDK
jgi:hypothetical protein